MYNLKKNFQQNDCTRLNLHDFAMKRESCPSSYPAHSGWICPWNEAPFLISNSNSMPVPINTHPVNVQHQGWDWPMPKTEEKNSNISYTAIPRVPMSLRSFCHSQAVYFCTETKKCQKGGNSLIGGKISSLRHAIYKQILDHSHFGPLQVTLLNSIMNLLWRLKVRSE